MEFSILNLLLVLLVAWAAGLLSRRFGYPSVLGELLAGILLGPPLLGLLQGGEALAVLAEVGIILMMLYIGMEIDPSALRKASVGGLLAAAGGFATPFVLCYLLIVGLGGTVMAGIFVGVAAGVTSLATKSRILVDLQLLDTRIAHVMMAGALIADTASLVIFAAVIGVAEMGSLELLELAKVAVMAIGFFAVATFAGLKGLPPLMGWVRRMRAGRTATFMLILVVTFLFAEAAELAGMHGILGAFVAGLFLREQALGYSLAREVMHLVRDVSIGFLAPVFFVTAGFAVSLDVFFTSPGLLVGVIALATLGKILGTALFYLPTRNGWREGMVLGMGMNGRGAVEIIIAQIALSLDLISQEVFSVLVFMALATTAAVPLMLKWGVDWLRGRGELVREGDRTGTLIVGAGPTARALAGILQRTEPVVIIDSSRENAAFAEAEGYDVVWGNALEEEVMSRAGGGRVARVVACTPNAQVNTLVAQLARRLFLVPEVLVLQSEADAEGHRTLVDHLGVSTLFGGAVALNDWDHDVAHDDAERTGLTLEQPVPASDLFRQLQKNRHTLPLAVRRGSQYLPFHSGLALHEGDRVITMRERGVVFLPMDRFDRLVHRCPVLDLDSETTAEDFFGMAAGMLAPLLDADRADLAERLAQRERTSSTVLLPGLAVPHVVIDGAEQFEMVVARSRDGILFPGQHERVHAAFVLVGSSDERTFHLRALAAIARIVQWPDFEARWLTARDAEALRDLLLHAARRRVPEKELVH